MQAKLFVDVSDKIFTYSTPLSKLKQDIENLITRYGEDAILTIYQEGCRCGMCETFCYPKFIKELEVKVKSC